MSIENSPEERKFEEVRVGPRTYSIPKDWEITQIGEIANVKYGKSLPDSDGEIPAVGSSGIYDEIGDSLIQRDTIVIGRKGSAGDAYLVREGCWPSDTTFYLTDLDSDLVNIEFLHYYMCHNSLAEEIEQTTLPSLDRNRLETYRVLTPSLPEQRRIANILSNVDEQIQQTDEIIKENEALRDGLLQDLFGCLNPNSGQKEVQLGPFQVQIPDHWVISDLDSLNQDDYPICYGVVQPGDHDEDGIPLLNIEDIDETGNIHRESIHKISLDLHEEYSRSQLQGGEVLVSVKGTVGSIVQLNEEIGEANISRDLARVTPTTDLDARWLKYCLSTKIYQDLIDVFSTGSTRASLNIGELREIPILCPPVPEQERISEVLSTVERKIEIERENKQYLQDLKRGLMQDLLTGKVRITSD